MTMWRLLSTTQPPKNHHHDTANWVGDWGYCSGCGDGLTYKGALCEACKSNGRCAEASVMARYRPMCVCARRESDDRPVGDDALRFELPDEGSVNHEHVAKACAIIATIRLLQGDSLRFCLGASRSAATA
jgi:hypothetical protein